MILGIKQRSRLHVLIPVMSLLHLLYFHLLQPLFPMASFSLPSLAQILVRIEWCQECLLSLGLVVHVLLGPLFD